MKMPSEPLEPPSVSPVNSSSAVVGDFDLLKGTVHTEMKICGKCTDTQAIQDLDEFIFA